MDHRWNEAGRQEAMSRGERERYGARPIERDPDVDRRDRLARMPVQQSPWEIGLAHYDQRDLYTRDARTDAAGYGRGPDWHPEEGSYAYHRELHPPVLHARSDATPQERAAWPWLNYHDVGEDPFMTNLHAQEVGLWRRIRLGAAELFGGNGRATADSRPDSQIREDIVSVLALRVDIDATDIEVTVKDAEVTLEGTVPDRATKRLAGEAAESVRGVRSVHNRLSIRPDEPVDANVAFVLPLTLLGGC